MKAEDRSVAIIGMAGRFPKADRLDQFLRNLQTGLDCIGDMSLQRMQRTNVDPAGSHQQMGFLSTVDAFDHAFFKISKGEADRMDPRQRLLLETCYQALENSTYPISHFSGSRTATYIADVALDYYRLADQFDPALYTGNLSSAMAGKVARMFNLRSKAMMIDTACSSGLVALHQACRDIRYGESDMALVAGCDLVLFPPSVDSDVKMGIESSSARSKTFSAQADGTGAGEAAVAVLLKSYRQAKEDGDPIHAIIRGSAANQDANLSASLTAPDAVAQSEALIEAWTDAGIDPSELGLIECHGTGTKLGDPIEIEGINLAFEKMSAGPNDCHVSAVKSNLGHTNSVAGLVSLAKVVLSIKFQERYPSVHFDAPNPLLDLEKYHLTVTREWTPWKTSGPRIAGISSFGMIGTNCHLVLSEEPVDASTSTEKSTTQYFSFSAPDEEAIQRHRTVLLDYAKQSNQWDAKALSKSLLSNRNQFAHRLSWWASDQTSFAKQLEQAAVSTPSSPEADNCFLLLSHFSPSQVNHSQCFDWAAQEAQTTREQIDALHKTFSIAGEFFFRLGLYHFLKKSAMSLDKVLADGSGKTLLNYINGKYKNLEEALREAEQAEASADVESRMAKFLNSKQESDIHFIELGPVANISEAVQSHKSPEQKIFTASSAAKDDLQAYFAELFEAGFDMAWRELPWLMAQPSDLLCPSYVFKPTRCWLKEADASTKQVDQTDLAKNIFYKIGKSPIDLSNARDVLTDKNILLVGPDEQLLQQVAKELSDKNTQVASIWLSDQFEVQHPGERYRIDWRRSTDYNDVEQELYMDDVEVDTVISIFPANENPQTAIDQDLMPLIHLLKSWHLRLSRENIRWVNVSLVPAAALGQNELASMQTAVMKGAGAEYRKSLFKNVQLSEEAASNWFDLLNDALQASITERFLYRDASGWHCDELEQLPFATSAFNHPPKGHYLITGGAVGIGFELAKHLAEKGAVGLYLIGRTDAKAKTKKAEKVRANLAYLQTTFGIAVSYFSADVSDGERMAEISQELGTQVERLDYIFHLAGVKGSWEPLVRKDVDDFVNTLRPKVAGTLHLENQFEKFQPKKLVAFSSLNSIIPQSNSIDYAVANAFLDAWAAINPSTRLAINWPGWKEAGMVKGLEDDRDSLKALSNEEGLQALDTSLGMGCANVLVADLDLRDLADNPYLRLPFQKEEKEQKEEVTEAEPKVTLVIDQSDWTETEKTIGQIWADVLGNEQITREDDFFDLGGHSLLGSMVINRIEATFGIQMFFEDIFDFSTIASQAVFIEEEAQKLAPNDPAPQLTVSAQSSYPLSGQQLGVWTTHQILGPNSNYNIPHAFVLPGSIQPDLLAQTIQYIIEEQPSLRTIFREEEGDPVQIIRPDLQYQLNHRDISDEPNKDEILQARMKEMAEFEFDLGKLPLFQFQLFQTEADTFVFLSNFHHIVCDAISLTQVFFPRLQAIYQQLEKGEEVTVNSQPLHYGTYALQQKELIQSGKMEAHKQFWLQKLKGKLNSIDLPYDFERPNRYTFDGDSVVFTIPHETVTAIKAKGSQAGVSLFNLFLSVLFILVRRYARRDDIRLGTTISNRDDIQYENIMGFFASLLVLPLSISLDDAIDQVIAKVKSSLLESFKYKDYPVEELIEEMGVDVHPSRYPFFELLFTWHNIAFDQKVNTLATQDYDLRGVVKFDMEIHGMESADGVVFYFGYNTNLFEKKTVENLVDKFRRIVEALIAQPNQSVGELQLSDSTEELVQSNAEKIDELFDF